MPLYWGAWIGSQLTGREAPWDLSAISRFSRITDKSPSIIHFAAPFMHCSSSRCRYYRFPTGQMRTVRRYGGIPFFSWSSQSIPSNVEEPHFQLSDVIAGKYDPHIRRFARAARRWGQPFFLRFNWEMNGDWFPWAERANGNAPGEYVTAWRHVHRIFTSVGAANATWVWCPHVDPNERLQSLRSLYPGSNYVDWSCLDGYNWGTNPHGVNPGSPNRSWKTFDRLYRSTYRRVVYRIAPGKPMIIGEIASSDYGGSKAGWIRNTLTRLPARYPAIRGLLWFEKRDSNMDWPIESSRAAIRAFAKAIQARAYARNAYAHISEGPIRPAH